MRYFLILTISLLMIFSCKSPQQKAKDNLINVKLQAQTGFSQFEKARKVLFPIDKAHHELSKDSLQVNQDFKEYVLRVFNIDENLAIYNQWKKGVISTKRWKKLMRVYEIDTTSLVNIKPSNKIRIVYGTLENGERAMQVDTDLDTSLKDEKLIPIDYPLEFIDDVDKDYYLKNKNQYLPQVNIKIQYEKQDSLWDHSFPLQINPYNVDDLISYVTQDEREKKYFLSVNIPQYFENQISINKDTFQIKIAGNFKTPQLDQEHTKILVNKTSTDSLKQKYSEFHVGDSLYFNDVAYSFRHISINGKELILKKLDRETKLYAFKERYYIPELEDFLFPDRYANQDIKPNTYIVWNINTFNEGLINKIKEYKQKHTNKQLAGIFYDHNKGGGKRLIDREKINWPNYFINPKKIKSLQLEYNLPIKIKVNSNNRIINIQSFALQSKGNSI